MLFNQSRLVAIRLRNWTHWRIIDRLDAIESPAIDDNCKAVKLEHHNLEMHDVSLLTEMDLLCSTECALTIPRGDFSSAALVGGSGSGKTTVAKLFARFYDATRRLRHYRRPRCTRAFV